MRPHHHSKGAQGGKFQSTHPNTRCDGYRAWVRSRKSNFNPRTPIRGATVLDLTKLSLMIFQSTHPNTRCDRLKISIIVVVKDFNPRTPIRGATRVSAETSRKQAISIHAPQYEVRQNQDNLCWLASSISIHAPQYEVRQFVFDNDGSKNDFNPRTPIRGATQPPHLQKPFKFYFNPRTPIRGATAVEGRWYKGIYISIHAPQYEVRHLQQEHS